LKIKKESQTKIECLFDVSSCNFDLEKIVEDVRAQNKDKNISDSKTINYLVGQVLKETKGKGNIQEIIEILKRKWTEVCAKVRYPHKYYMLQEVIKKYLDKQKIKVVEIYDFEIIGGNYKEKWQTIKKPRW